jgi:hypothetical protein
VYQKDQGYQRRFQHIIMERNEKIKTTWTLTLLGKERIMYTKTQLKQMTLYDISCKDSNNYNICDFTDKHVNFTKTSNSTNYSNIKSSKNFWQEEPFSNMECNITYSQFITIQPKSHHGLNYKQVSFLERKGLLGMYFITYYLIMV